MLCHARDRGIRDAFLEVRRSNKGAIALYHELGFECVGQRRGYYQAHEGREDALVYRLELGALARRLIGYIIARPARCRR